ncbi:MAG TPA: EAL domain-containing protein, partial [Noviherbaspirillum sp.]|nr:EAL domain-containing protein [Noviherbaspirillum sp.]
GIKVVLDDFGVGCSSLGDLGTLPLDKLKIDKSLTSRTQHDAQQRPITGGIIALGRSLQLEVVGEGVESEQAMDYLRAHGCDHAQGYLFSRPLPPGEFEAWCRQRLGMVH